MPKVVYEGKIDGEFKGFNNEAIFKMINGVYWIQSENKYWNHYAYCPEVIVTEEKGKYTLTVAGNSVPVIKPNDVIESKIDGEFNGWNEDTVYKLLNGQVWKQSNYNYIYKYEYMPKVIIYSTRSGYKMRVSDTVADVERIV